MPHAPRELVLNADRGGRSAEGVRQEEPSDLGYRGLMPTSLGVCLQQASPLSRDAPEEYALLRERGGIELEASVRSAAAKRAAPAIRVTSLLMLGIRKIRACYLQRVEGCLALMELALSDWGGPAVDPGEAPPPPPQQRASHLAPCSVVRWTGFVPAEGTPMAGADAGSCHSPYKHGIPRSVPAARCGH